MSNTNAAEKVLQTVTSPESARAIAGDLIETFPGKGLAYWLSLLRILLAFIWKPALSATVALLVWFLVDSALSFAFTRGVLALNVSSPDVLPHGMRLIHGSSTLAALACYTVLNDGRRNRLWVMGIVFALATGTLVFSVLVFNTRPISLCVLLGITAVGVSTPEMRRSSWIIAASFSASYLPSLLWELLLNRVAPGGISQNAFLTGYVLSTFGTPLSAMVVSRWMRVRVLPLFSA